MVQSSLAATMLANPKLCRREPELWNRVKFTMKKDDIDAAINDLKEAVQVLETLRQRSQQLNEAEVMTTARLSKRRANILYGIRSKALMLYRALLSSWNWQTQCHDSHVVRLFLENSHAQSSNSARHLPVADRWHLSFNLAFEGLKSSNPDMYHACGVEVVDSDGSSGQSASVPNVRFALPSQTQPAGSTTKSVDDICHVIKQSTVNAEQLRLFLDDTGKLCYKNLNATPNVAAPILPPQTKLVTLQDVLSMPNMSLKSRVKIAALVATSVIQLHSTPWCSTLGRDSFYFVQDATGAVDLENPFVVCHFNQYTRMPTGKVKVEVEMELLNLGILILELWHNSTIEVFAAGVHLALEDTYSSRHDAARRWLAECKNNLLPDVHGAAVRCIGCRFDVVDADLEDMKMVVGIYEGVVKPLWMLASGNPNY